MEKDNGVMYLILGILAGAVITYVVIKLLQKQSSMTVSLGRDKDGRLTEYTVLPLYQK